VEVFPRARCGDELLSSPCPVFCNSRERLSLSGAPPFSAMGRCLLSIDLPCRTTLIFALFSKEEFSFQSAPGFSPGPISAEGLSFFSSNGFDSGSLDMLTEYKEVWTLFSSPFLRESLMSAAVFYGKVLSRRLSFFFPDGLGLTGT